MLAKGKMLLARPVDGASLAFFRVGFGAIIFWEALRYFYYDWVTDVFVKPGYLFSFPWAPVTPWPRGGLYVHFFVLGLAGFCVSLGLFYRVAAWTLALTLTYVFLLDASYSLDLNHLYLMVLLALLLATMPADAVCSVDNRLFGREPKAVPFWCVLLLRAQIFVVFFFAGLAKLSPTWLDSHPAQQVLANNAAAAWILPLFRLPQADSALKFGGLALDLCLPWLLLARPTRRLGLALVAAFMTVNGLIFPIGVFPALAVLAAAMFLEPQWPRRRAGKAALPQTTGFALSRFLAPLYLIVQFALPLRAFIYPGPSAWSEEGHFYSWRMMGIEKQGTLALTVTNPVTGLEADWDLARELTPRQIHSLSTRPLLVHQYARHVADEVELHEKVRPLVKARQSVALGSHPAQLIIDPGRDLASEPYSLGAYSWILPLADP